VQFNTAFKRGVMNSLKGPVGPLIHIGQPEELDMTIVRKAAVAIASGAVFIGSASFLATSIAGAKQDKYALQVPGGLAFAEFKGFEQWEAVSVSYNERAIALIVANPAMIEAYKAGIPANGKAVPDGAKFAKIHWKPKKSEFFPTATVPGAQHDVDFMVKDSRRFSDSGGWGYAVFRYDAESDTFRPATMADTPAQRNDAKCGFACHTIVKGRDYVFTEYGHR
jgi:hypothetical protein